MWLCRFCTYLNERLSTICLMCNHSRSDSWRASHQIASLMLDESDAYAADGIHESADSISRSRFFVCSIIPGLISTAISGILICMLAIVGAFSGAIIGAVGQHARDSGFFHGIGLGAVTGTLLMIELQEAFCKSWNSDQAASRTSMAELLDSVLRGRFIEDYVGPAMLTPHRWQVSLEDMEEEELYEIFEMDERGSKGAPEISLKNLPWHVILGNEMLDRTGEKIYCSICLQNFEQGEMVRCLPPCQHLFHMVCIDKWLTRHGSCPICRHIVLRLSY